MQQKSNRNPYGDIRFFEKQDRAKSIFRKSLRRKAGILASSLLLIGYGMYLGARGAALMAMANRVVASFTPPPVQNPVPKPPSVSFIYPPGMTYNYSGNYYAPPPPIEADIWPAGQSRAKEIKQRAKQREEEWMRQNQNPLTPEFARPPNMWTQVYGR